MIILQNQGADDGAQEGSTVHPAYGDSVMNDLTVPPGREETSDGSGPTPSSPFNIRLAVGDPVNQLKVPWVNRVQRLTLVSQSQVSTKSFLGFIGNPI